MVKHTSTLRIWMIIFLSAFIFLAFVSFNHAENSFIITDARYPDKKPILISDTIIDQHTSSFQSFDPNYKRNKINHYSGISFTDMMKQTPFRDFNGITIIATDQFLNFIPNDMLIQSGGMIANKLDNQKISPHKSGPFRVMYPPEHAQNTMAYVWNVETIITDTFNNPELKINEHSLTSSQMKSFIHQEKQKRIPRPSGSYSFQKKDDAEKLISYVLLNDLLKNFSITGQTITFTPLAGKKIIVSSDVIKDIPVKLITKIDNHFIHPALGGPFMIVFPIQHYPELSNVLQESANLFFLNKIVVK